MTSRPDSDAQSVARPTQKPEVPDSIPGSAGFDTRFSHILSFLLPLIQNGQLSVTDVRMCTKYWLNAKEV